MISHKIIRYMVIDRYIYIYILILSNILTIWKAGDFPVHTLQQFRGCFGLSSSCDPWPENKPLKFDASSMFLTLQFSMFIRTLKVAPKHWAIWGIPQSSPVRVIHDWPRLDSDGRCLQLSNALAHEEWRHASCRQEVGCSRHDSSLDSAIAGCPKNRRSIVISMMYMNFNGHFRNLNWRYLPYARPM